FKDEFAKTAIGTFGSGWAWLVQRPDGSLGIVSTQNAQNPLTGPDRPLLTLDVWEHAYYIDYRNARPKFVDAFWNVVNWDFAAQNMAAANPSPSPSPLPFRPRSGRRGRLGGGALGWCEKHPSPALPFAFGEREGDEARSAEGGE